MKSYVVACSSSFRDAVLDLAHRRGLTATDLALSVIALIDRPTIAGQTDPGGPAPGDRETVELKTGPRRGRILTRKPRLQVRLPAGLPAASIRKALTFALALDKGAQTLAVASPEDDRRRDGALAAQRATVAKTREAVDEIRVAMQVIAFDPAIGAVMTAEQAYYILGLPPGKPVTMESVKTRFRQLSRVYHPDRPTGDSARMGLLIDAVRYLESRFTRRRSA
ncbi:MAG: J domain-containing protein [Inquilinus sp.]|nr:J domain-containing protein [Inquilinus sp.]